jgi:hypothetical protein
MHRKKLEPPHAPAGATARFSVHSTKGREKFFQGAFATRAEAESVARAITLPPHGHDTAVIRQSPGAAMDRRASPADSSFKPVLATVDGEATKAFGGARQPARVRTRTGGR